MMDALYMFRGINGIICKHIQMLFTYIKKEKEIKKKFSTVSITVTFIAYLWL